MPNMNNVLYLMVVPDSEAERFVVNEIVPKLKDGCSVILGALYGATSNMYGISERDRNRVIISRLVKEFEGIY